MKQHVTERRKITRLPDSLVIRHRVLGSKSTKERSVSKNLSSDGVLLPSSRRLTAHSTLELEIHFPLQILPVFALGEVMWIKKEWEDARQLYDIGIHITDIDEYDEDRIRNYIQSRTKENS